VGQHSICDIFVFSVEVLQELFVYELPDHHFYLSAHLLYTDNSYILLKGVFIILVHVTLYLVEYD